MQSLIALDTLIAEVKQSLQIQPKHQKMSKLKALQAIAPNVFVPGYARVVQKSRQPIILKRNEIKAWCSQTFIDKDGKTQHRQAMPFPPVRQQQVGLDDPRIEFWFGAPSDEFPYPCVKRNQMLDNMEAYPYIPCCSAINQLEDPKSVYYEDAEQRKIWMVVRVARKAKNDKQLKEFKEARENARLLNHDVDLVGPHISDPRLAVRGVRLETLPKQKLWDILQKAVQDGFSLPNGLALSSRRGELITAVRAAHLQHHRAMDSVKPPTFVSLFESTQTGDGKGEELFYQVTTQKGDSVVSSLNTLTVNGLQIIIGKAKWEGYRPSPLCQKREHLIAMIYDAHKSGFLKKCIFTKAELKPFNK
jgi:hypothetical protein